MARARNIKPAIMDNEDLADLDPLTRLLFVYLWMLADRDGRMEDRPKRIAAQALPYDRAADAEKMLADLHASGFIHRYEVNGVAVIQITAFLKHQTPHGTEKDGTLPDESGMYTVNSRGKNGYATGETSLSNAPSTVKQPSSNSALTVKEPLDNTLIPDSLIPDSLIPDSLIQNKAQAPAARKRAASFDAKAIELPDWLDAELWGRWVDDRKERKKPITKGGAKGQLSKLDEYRLSGRSPKEVIEHSIANGYQGLFPPSRQLPASHLQSVQTVSINPAVEETRRMLAEQNARWEAIKRERAEKKAREAQEQQA